MNSPDGSTPLVTIPTIPISAGAAILIALTLVVAIVVFCQVWYPRKLETAFHVPDGIHGITATELILFRIFVMASFIFVLKEILLEKLL